MSTININSLHHSMPTSFSWGKALAVGFAAVTSTVAIASIAYKAIKASNTKSTSNPSSKASESYISPKAARGLESTIHGQGLFAKENIQKGQIVCVKGGTIVTKAELAAAKVKFHAEMQISEDLFIAPLTEEEYAKSMMCLNHSCEPNLGIRGDIVFVAMRNINRGEELTADYAMMDDTASSFSCACGKENCRKIITGKDWMKREIQEKYEGYFSAYIQQLINSR